MEFIWEIIKKRLRKIENKRDVPVICIIYKTNDKKEYYVSCNTREKEKNISGHAEINAINKVFRKTKSKNLSEYTLVTTMSPCEMCYGAIKQTYINNVMYLINNEKNGIININDKIRLRKIENKEIEDQYKQILKEFFEKRR